MRWEGVLGRDQPDLGETAGTEGAQKADDVGGGHGEPFGWGGGGWGGLTSIVLLALYHKTNERPHFLYSMSSLIDSTTARVEADGRKVRGDRTRRAILAAAVNLASVEGPRGPVDRPLGAGRWSCSSSFEPKWAKRPLLVILSSVAKPPIERPSRPSTDARLTAAARIARRARSPRTLRPSASTRAVASRSATLRKEM